MKWRSWRCLSSSRVPGSADQRYALRAWMGDEVEISAVSFFKSSSWERGPEVRPACLDERWSKDLEGMHFTLVPFLKVT
jgi:hypothetical protein